MKDLFRRDEAFAVNSSIIRVRRGIRIHARLEVRFLIHMGKVKTTDSFATDPAAHEMVF
jgi:hypothetical protein